MVASIGKSTVEVWRLPPGWVAALQVKFEAIIIMMASCERMRFQPEHWLFPLGSHVALDQKEQLHQRGIGGERALRLVTLRSWRWKPSIELVVYS